MVTKLKRSGIVIAAMATLPLAGHAAALTRQPSFAERCTGLGRTVSQGIESAFMRPAGPLPGADPQRSKLVIPEHCEINGILDRRVGMDGQRYAIRYHLRLPRSWNGRFLFEGGGGTNGVAGDALGQVGSARAPAIVDGYAVVSQDSGHDNRINDDPDRGGTSTFGRDPVARAAYGGTSLKRVADSAKAVIASFYGRAAERSYFYGCSKGGQEGMVFAQRYPEAFDGIVAAAPGFALPRAALAQVWDVQTFDALAPTHDFLGIVNSFSEAQLALVRQVVLATCDADDGLKDGIVGRFDRCTTARIEPALRHLSCRSGQVCLSAAQIGALIRSIGGPRDAEGRALYAHWPWDGGVGADGWRVWKLGSARMPSLSIITGGPALATIFSVPPVALHDDPKSFLDYELRFDFSRDASRIYATSDRFPRSAWADLAAQSDDLDAFRGHGGKLIVPHGASDPVFSILDTLDWYRRVSARYPGTAADFARVFAVPGMNHCAGGPATDSFDAFDALVKWVERGEAPERIDATAGPETPWPGRKRPLCPWPRIAVYRGTGSTERAESFTCNESI